MTAKFKSDIRRVRRSSKRVLPEPTGPPTPIITVRFVIVFSSQPC